MDKGNRQLSELARKAGARLSVSPTFQVVIPKKVREELQLRSGQELQIYIPDQTIRLRRVRSIKELRGIAKGMR